MFNFLKESRGEIQKVQWPKREEIMNSTVVVLVVIAIISIFLFLIDNIFDQIFDWIVI